MCEGELQSGPRRVFLGELAKRCHCFPKGREANVIQGVSYRLLMNEIIAMVMS